MTTRMRTAIDESVGYYDVVFEAVNTGVQVL
jgi:hypothetical protein